ncbi:SlyX family protein [Pikeienuella sp. HZG-20]|uniref:SlyX family protein n=1 Tax=Paludibacillus litoralis TaxID=3133267 RepID=UPI0030EBC560
MTSDRIEALEIALTHAEAAIIDLSDICRAQGLEIDALKQEIGKLTRTLNAVASDSGGDAPAADQRPPHY